MQQLKQATVPSGIDINRPEQGWIQLYEDTPESASYWHSLYTYEHTRKTPAQETPITLASNPRGRGEPNPLQN